MVIFAATLANKTRKIHVIVNIFSHLRPQSIERAEKRIMPLIEEFYLKILVKMKRQTQIY